MNDISLLQHYWWFLVSLLGALLVFHGMRARREIRCPETEAEEPVMTKAEYDALRQAAMAAEEATEEAAEEAATDENEASDAPAADEADGE